MVGRKSLPTCTGGICILQKKWVAVLSWLGVDKNKDKLQYLRLNLLKRGMATTEAIQYGIKQKVEERSMFSSSLIRYYIGFIADHSRLGTGKEFFLSTCAKFLFM